MPIHTFAGTALLPLAAILIGLTFSWSGNAQALLADAEIEKMATDMTGGIAEYVYRFQLGIFITLVTIISWGIAASKLLDPLNVELISFFNNTDTICGIQCSIEVVDWALYSIVSLCLRTCWQVVLGSQALLLTRFAIRKHRILLQSQTPTVFRSRPRPSSGDRRHRLGLRGCRTSPRYPPVRDRQS